MHESRLAHDLVDKAALVAVGEDAIVVDTVCVRIGALNHATPGSLRSILRDVAVGSVVADADWDINKSNDEAASDALDVRLVSVTIREV
jgi:Zn finger protein HypA/HybF involved in hydrogenase expression